ncbi:MAG: helix-turn-helix domain-containing protein [Pseudomonadota bacterium]
MSTRGKIIEAADALIYAGSIREASVDRIAEQAGITKKTLYYHFKSKDDLVAAYLEARDKPTIERYQDWAGTEGALPDRIERMFLTLAENAEKKAWKGCGFLRAAVELADSPGHPALDVARRHKAAFEQWLADDIGHAGHADSVALARMIMVLLDGTVARMLVQRDPVYARDAAVAARLLLEGASAAEPMYTD